MNEVTKIHLGRQAFTISADAHKELRTYLAAIKQHVSDEDVIDEIELRMSELLEEHGVTGEQVILPADVRYLKEQLGDPKDFAEDSGQESNDVPSAESKRLFRDTDNAMLAGVAAGLGNYFGISPLVVRLLFVIATFAGGWGILIYLVLWILVPEAKTSSERLQMVGKPVNIHSLKEAVERADVKGAAQRANRSLAKPIYTAFDAVLKVIGVCIVVFGLGLLLTLAGGATYAFLKNGTIFQGSVFPVGFKEHLLVYIAGLIAAILAGFIVLIGVALYRRRWPIHVWITGTLLGLLFIGLAVGSALTADVVPEVRDRYNANLHTTVRTLPPFTTVNLNNIGSGDEVIQYQQSSSYSVSLHYYGQPNLSTIKTTVQNKVLTIDTMQFQHNRTCDTICIPNSYELIITVTAPTIPQAEGPDYLTNNWSPSQPIIPGGPALIN